MRAYSVALLVLLVGCVAGQLVFPGALDARAGTGVRDTLAPCGGRTPTYKIANSTSSNVTLEFTIVGNHGYPNTISISETTDYNPQDQGDFELAYIVYVEDGDLSTHEITVDVPENSVKSFHYETGAYYYYYCLDVQNGDYKEQIAAAGLLTFSPLLLMVSVFFFLL